MGQDIVQEIIRKAVVDAEFRKSLLNNAADALEGYNLTEEQLVAFSKMTAEAFDDESGTLEERVSRGIELQ